MIFFSFGFLRKTRRMELTVRHLDGGTVVRRWRATEELMAQNLTAFDLGDTSFSAV